MRRIISRHGFARGKSTIILRFCRPPDGRRPTKPQKKVRKTKVLVACEESQTVCKAFRERGHEAYSCDIQEPSGGHPEWHILGDALEAVRGGIVRTMDGQTHDVGKWDMLIAHPPCTYLSNAGANRLRIKGIIQKERMKKSETGESVFSCSLGGGLPACGYRKPDSRQNSQASEIHANCSAVHVRRPVDENNMLVVAWCSAAFCDGIMCTRRKMGRNNSARSDKTE